ncbi:MAG TPA: DUF3551 domain-containing protein [Xanthobacteraceae bacterium]|jgi:hypothetical protein
MRIIWLALGASIAATALPSGAVAAPVYRYCAHYEDRGDITCAYDTFQQCLDTARGPAGGTCSENPAYRPPLAAPSPHKAKHKSG